MRRTIAKAAVVVTALAVLGAAWAHGPTRQKVRESIEINAPPAKVWAVIGNFQDMSWLQPVSKTEGTKGNAIEATRRLTLAGGATVDEELYKYDANQKLTPLQGEEIGQLIAHALSSRVAVRRPWYEPSEKLPDEPIIGTQALTEFDTVVVEMPSTRNSTAKGS